jgi:hypothetical protein
MIEDVGVLGDCEQYRELLGNSGVTMQANRLYWITDQTPHESLPVEERVYRQFFRLVTSDVSLWYEAHSDYNPLGTMPTCPIVSDSKFILK